MIIPACYTCVDIEFLAMTPYYTCNTFTGAAVTVQRMVRITFSQIADADVRKHQ